MAAQVDVLPVNCGAAGILFQDRSLARKAASATCKLATGGEKYAKIMAVAGPTSA